MGSGTGSAQERAEEDALIDLVPLLLRLGPGPFGRQAVPGGHEPGEDRRRARGQFGHSQVAGAALGEFVVHGFGVHVEEGRAQDPGGGPLPLGGVPLSR